jgi:hypothetical protein
MKTTKTMRSIMVVCILASFGIAYAEDDVDTSLHSQVMKKVQSDHRRDVKLGRLQKRSPASVSRSNGGASGPSSLTVVAISTDTHPTQVQELQVKKKASTTVAKKATK